MKLTLRELHLAVANQPEKMEDDLFKQVYERLLETENNLIEAEEELEYFVRF